MPATALRCRICETEHALEAVGICSRCLGPLDPVYDRAALARAGRRARRSRRPPVDLALRADCCPSRRRPSSGSRPG